MRGLTLTQPWASLVAAGAKRWETRGWSTGYRGPLAIHAAKGFPRDCQELCFESPFAESLVAGGITKFGGVARGAIVAVADLVGCHRTCCAPWRDTPAGVLSVEPAEREADFGNYADGRFFFELAHIRRLREPMPYKGALGLWVIPPDVVAEINAAVAA